MECPLGSTASESQHEVKTITKAREWFQDVRVCDLPIKVAQFTAANGRCMIRISNKHGKIIHRRG